MEKNDLDKFIERSDAFDTRKLLEGVDLSNVAEEIDLEEILAEYGKRPPSCCPHSDTIFCVLS